MERKKMVRIAIIVFISIVALIVVEVSLRGIKTVIDNHKEKVENEQKEEKIKETVEYKEEKYLENVVSEIAKLLNQKNVDALYELTENIYIDYKFQNDKEKFSNYISNYFSSGEREYEFQTYENKYGRYICRMLAAGDGGVVSYKFLVKPKENEAYDIIFDDIDFLKEYEETPIVLKNLQYTLKYTGKNFNNYFYVLEIKNVGTKKIEYVYDSVSLKNSYGTTYEFDASGLELSINPGEKARYEYVFSGSNIGLYEHTRIDVKLKDLKGNSENFSVYL